MVKVLLENFPEVDLKPLDKFIFDTMKKVLLRDADFSGVVKKVLEKKDHSNDLGGLNETKID